ncbi:MAG: hypothetical protein JOZ51_08630 [Chloroflexi bacterium]|nr:hypothetical protein [Chloroflexota bacterium]
MEELLQQLSQHPDVTITVQTGIPDWYTGEIRLVIRGDGTITAHKVRSKGEQTYAGRLDAAQVQELGIELATHGFTQIQPASALTRVPDDVPVVLRIERGTERLYEARLWHADRFADPGLDRILRRADELIAQLSRDALPC